jgi:nitrite reductase/ring-hydroxylating ferredoxin subunit
MPELTPEAAGLLLCQGDELAEKGRAVVFDVMVWHQPARGFALRVDGAVRAYVNRCAHVPTELDWQPGEFWNADRTRLICSIHGAEYDARNGHCRGGPCNRGRLLPIEVREIDGEVYWYPSRDVTPVVFEV